MAPLLGRSMKGAWRTRYTRHGRLPRMASSLIAVPAPRAPIYRVGRMPDPFAPSPWAYAKPDGTFGNRFDDPGGRRGIPQEDRFRVLYCASDSAGACAETVAYFRPELATMVDANATPPGSRVGRPIIPEKWRIERRIGATVLHPSLRFVDMAAAETVQALRPILAPLALSLGLREVDFSTLAGPERLLTQEAARYIYEQVDAAGEPLYAGLRYLSRLNPVWECWAIFADRLRHMVVRVDIIPANHPGLFEAARILGLAIEESHGHYLLP